jgi:hypothetical protein
MLSKKLTELAIDVALATPLHPGPVGSCAYVSWDTINLMREEMTRIGLDWKKLCKRTHEIIVERRKQHTQDAAKAHNQTAEEN